MEHRIVDAAGTRIHLASLGEGPTVLMVHGFPESWYSWRYQMTALAEAGYRAVAMDVRGYGRSAKPTAVADYRMVRNVSDVVGVVDALGEGPVALVGHDWGAPIAWTSALLRPDRFRGVAGLSVPYAPPSAGPRPTAAMRAMAGPDAEFYVEYFQSVGRAEAEIEKDVRQWLLGFYWCAGGNIENGPNISLVPKGTEMRDQFQYPAVMPSWMTEEDLDYYTAAFEAGGFFGPLSRYRNVDRDWEDLRAFSGQPIIIPSLFIGGDRDGPTLWGAPAIAKFSETLPKLHRSEILAGCGHWVQQERSEETNALLLDWLGALP